MSFQKLSFSQDLLRVKTEDRFQEIPSISTSALSYLSKNAKATGMTRVIFVRHGESESNARQCIAGQTHDSPLSSKGERQAQATGQSLSQAAITIDIVFTSPMTRAKKTAEHILAMLQLNHVLHEDKRLHERFYGPYEGATHEVVVPLRKKEIDEIALLKTFSQKFAYKAHPEMESIESVYMRVSHFLAEITAKHAQKTIFIAAHNGVLKSLVMADAARRGYDLEFRQFDLANCALIVLEIDPHGRTEVTATEGLTFANVCLQEPAASRR